MTKGRTGNNQFLKQFNKTVILDLIRTHKSVSKAELSQITGLSPTAIGMITSSLLEEEYIYETGTGESKGGRRPIMLELRPKSFYSLGVDYDVNYINVTLIDITGEIVCESQTRIKDPEAFSAVMKRTEAVIQDIMAKFSVRSERLLGIGFSIPGMVDSETHEVIFAPNLGWRNIDMKLSFKGLPGVPLYVENEAMASAICENWIGCCQDINNFVCINIKSGIGAGIFTHGRLYRGANGSAGEVGHVVVDENGPKCGCGNYGCLETVASTGWIVEKARRLVRQGAVSSLNTFENPEDIGIDEIIAAAKAGDEAAKGILVESARYLGIAISNIVNTLNPSKVVIGKEFVKYSDVVIEYIKEVVGCKALSAAAANVEIMPSFVGERASTLGAAIVPLKALFGR